jgi:hypothetical protein
MQLPSLTGLRTRFRERVDGAARGSDVPAGIERGADAVAPTGSRGRGRLRRRLRELRRLREAQLLELGALVLEAHKQERGDSPVIKSKVAEAAATDAEARAVADALQTDAGLDTIVTAGIAGPCPTCGTLTSTAARFCSNCRTPLDRRPDATARSVDAAETPLADARVLEDRTDAARADACEPNAPGAAAADGSAAHDAPTTELPASNGNGSSPEELEAASGRDS